MNKEIVDTLTKVHEFIEANKNTNYKIRLLEREVPNIGKLVKNLNMHFVNNSLQDKLYGALIMAGISAFLWLIYICANCC